MSSRKISSLHGRIRNILESARAGVARTVNSTQVAAYWLIGREIVEEEQGGQSKAAYGGRLLEELSARLTQEFGGGYSVQNLRFIRQLYLTYPRLLGDSEIRYAPRSELAPGAGAKKIPHAVRANGAVEKAHAARGQLVAADFIGAARQQSWKPGRLHPNLSWTHYRTLLRVDKAEARSFYEIEAIGNNWSSRELERQVNSLLYERLALSRDKKGLMRLARKGHEVQAPADAFKDPLVMEFLGLPASSKLVESDLEQALIDNLQTFLLELGRGFAFVSRQERITLDGDHFYIDLVFYHTLLKCYVLIDLKIGKLSHQDLGQLQLYVNYYDRRRRTKGDDATLGLILCTDKNDAVVKYTLSEDQQKKIFASRYKLHLPTEAELKTEIRRELKVLRMEATP